MQEIEKAYTQHAKEVYRYLLSLSHSEDLAEELTQETFFRAMRTIHSYDGSCKLSVWLCQIGKHLWYQWLEKHRRYQSVELLEELPGGDSPEHNLLFRMEKTALYKAIQIGEIVGKSENWARTTFYRAKKKMMEEMEEFR